MKKENTKSENENIQKNTNALTAQQSQGDPFLWLEEIESERSLNWARSHNAISEKKISTSPLFNKIENEIRQILLAKDRIPAPRLRGKFVYNFWQDSKSVRGLWRRTTLEEYQKPSPNWETIIDVDSLAKSENENWVWAGAFCHHPDNYQKCLIKLSRGGKDAAVFREFDTKSKKFVKNGFEIKEAKSFVSWLDENTLFVGTDWGPSSLTSSGYPRIVKLWKRGTPLDQAPTVFEGNASDVGVGASVISRPEGTFVFFVRSISFYETEYWTWSSESGIRKLDLPTSADLSGVFKGQALILLRKDWQKESEVYSAGTLLQFPLNSNSNQQPERIFIPSKNVFISSIATTPRSLFVSVMDKVRGRILRLSQNPSAATTSGNGWSQEKMELPENGAVSFISADDENDSMIVSFESFLQPTTYYFVKNPELPGTVELLKQMPTRFNSHNLTVHQYESTSADGTKVPYFAIHRRDIKLNGTTPTILYGYGGFEVSLTPSYLGHIGKSWLERGGAYVLANIRGGGEFGPLWHQAALLHNRHRAFEDFISIAEDLNTRKIADAKHLGIWGGSNGGLLVSAVTVQRPDLFGSVVCQVPLTDMLRFHKLLAGASWMAEYGNPDVPSDRSYLETYSPYQNLKKASLYPEMLVTTSTKDDRVHPGHARKFAARLEELGHPVLYYENIQGGHGGAANLEEKVKLSALAMSYFSQKLFLK